jgi:proteasome assembly chaperone (PAC2) family protein
MEGVKITRRVKLKNPTLIAAWPGMGEVAIRAASYLVEKLKASEFAQLLPQDFFYQTGSVIQKGLLGLEDLPTGKFYYWKDPSGKSEGDLVVFISSAQPDLSKAQAYCQRLIELAKSLEIRQTIGFAAFPQPIEHTQGAQVWFSATSLAWSSVLKKYNLRLMSEGQISGMNGLFLGAAKKAGLEGFCLLGEIPLYTIQIENPKASAAVLAALSRILRIQIDLSGLVSQAQAMEQEINRLLDYLKLAPQTQAGPIGEEEIERIKKSLTQLTRLPKSAKEKIEKLFQEAKEDISKAHLLKYELDQWNAYKEYEDRFLDLFKKSKDKSN